MKFKTTILVLLSLILVLTGYIFFREVEMIQFQLIEAATNHPLKNRELQVKYCYNVHYDTQCEPELVMKLKTDSFGNFEIPEGKLIKKFPRYTRIDFGDKYKFQYLDIKNEKIILSRYKNGFSRITGSTHYDLNSKVEMNVDLQKDTIISSFEKIKLIAYDKESYFEKLKKGLEYNKPVFKKDPLSLWNFYGWSMKRLNRRIL
ncbi:MAG: hypothetical protein R2784_08610 [Saprospiraceae bacterium]